MSRTGEADINVSPAAIAERDAEIAEASEEEFLAWWEWDRMTFSLGEECDRFNCDPWIKALEPAPTLRLEYMARRWSRITYLRGSTRRVMHVTYSVPLRCCAFQMHGQPVVYKQYLMGRGGTAYFQVYLPGKENRHKTETREEAARRILRVFLCEVIDGYRPAGPREC
jgi:hypothetical protein